MKQALTSPADMLKKNKIRASQQRIKVLDYLLQNHCHPTVDQIYSGLLKETQVFSKTTIYNTLNLLVVAGLVRVVSIENNEARYDIATQNHGHFKCESCGAIYDFNIDIDSFATDGLANFIIHDKNVYFKGVCSGCLSSININ
jgi:Fur family transcriptional regulator, peroxide stress response regulator